MLGTLTDVKPRTRCYNHILHVYNHCISFNLRNQHSATSVKYRTFRSLYPDFVCVVVVREVNEAIVVVVAYMTRVPFVVTCTPRIISYHII